MSGTPDLFSVILSVVRWFVGEVNTAIPARILRYYPEERRCDVQPLVKRRYKDGQVLSRAAITDVPVCFPSGGGATMSFPLRPGDTVLLVFSQRSIDRWLRSDGGEVDPLDNRKHDISDAVAIPGLYSFPAALPADPENVIIKYAGAEFALTPSGAVQITAPGGVAIQGDLVVSGEVTAGPTSIELTTHTHSGVEPGGGVSGPPVPGP